MQLWNQASVGEQSNRPLIGKVQYDCIVGFTTADECHDAVTTDILILHDACIAADIESVHGPIPFVVVRFELTTTVCSGGVAEIVVPTCRWTNRRSKGSSVATYCQSHAVAREHRLPQLHNQPWLTPDAICSCPTVGCELSAE
jgi:hypothetical protein